MRKQENQCHKGAIEFLLNNTHALQDVIERFVELYWQNDISEEENLVLFEEYENEMQTVYSY